MLLSCDTAAAPAGDATDAGRPAIEYGDDSTRLARMKSLEFLRFWQHELMRAAHDSVMVRF
ncbi:MAG: hypothetical protein CMN73_08295 [Sphingomonas sp.]|nr:hypothetical protein [Sphingomonas sp.]